MPQVRQMLRVKLQSAVEFYVLDICFSDSVCLITEPTIVNLSTRSQQNTSSIFYT